MIITLNYLLEKVLFVESAFHNQLKFLVFLNFALKKFFFLNWFVNKIFRFNLSKVFLFLSSLIIPLNKVKEKLDVLIFETAQIAITFASHERD